MKKGWLSEDPASKRSLSEDTGNHSTHVLWFCKELQKLQNSSCSASGRIQTSSVFWGVVLCICALRCCIGVVVHVRVQMKKNWRVLNRWCTLSQWSIYCSLLIQSKQCGSEVGGRDSNSVVVSESGSFALLDKRMIQSQTCARPHLVTLPISLPFLSEQIWLARVVMHTQGRVRWGVWDVCGGNVDVETTCCNTTLTGWRIRARQVQIHFIS